MLVLVIGVSRQNRRLSSTVAELSGMVEKERVSGDDAKRVAEVLHAKDAAPFEILPVEMKTRMPSGKAVYSRDRSGTGVCGERSSPVARAKSLRTMADPNEEVHPFRRECLSPMLGALRW